MNEKNDNFYNRNKYFFNICKSIRKSIVQMKTKKLNEGLDFRRTTSACILNTEGEKPLILYHKSPKKKFQKRENKVFESQFNILHYISDGGLKQKKNKILNLISHSPFNYKNNSPNKYKKENKKNLKKNNYNSLSTNANRILTKNKTSIEYFNYNEEPNIVYSTTRKKMKNNLYCQIEKNIIKKNEEKNNNIKSEKKEKMKERNKKDILKKLIKTKKILLKFAKDKKPNLKFIERKKQVLKNNGIDISQIETPKVEKNKDILYKKKVEEEKNENDNTKNISNYNHVFDLNNNNYLNNNSAKIKVKNKPIIDQFEFINKILKAHKDLSPNNKSNIKLSMAILKKYFKIKNKNNNNKRNNKLNISSYVNKNKETKLNNDNTNATDEAYDEYPYIYRKTHRAQEELKAFIKLKKIKEKNITKENELELKQKLFLRFKNLYKLNLENINSERLYSNNFRNNKIKNTKNIIKKRKEGNKYYTGKEIIKDNSTFIEKNDYYLALYQSQQVITNSNINLSNKFLESLSLQFNVKKNINDRKNNIYNLKPFNKFAKKIKKIFVKKAFKSLSNNYYHMQYYYQYYLAFNYLIAIIKQYPFNKIYHYENEVYDKKNKIDNNNIIFFVKILTLIFKIKIFEKLFTYCQQIEINIVREKLENVFKLFVKPYLKYTFQILKYQSINRDNNNDDSIVVHNKNSEINNLKQKEKYLNNIVDNPKNEENKINNKIINNNKNNKIIKTNNNINQYIEEIEDEKEYKLNKKGKDENDSLKHISAEKDYIRDISWEYNFSNEKNEKNKQKNENEISKIPKEKEDNDDYGDLHDMNYISDKSDIDLDNKKNEYFENDKNKLNNEQNHINNGKDEESIITDEKDNELKLGNQPNNHILNNNIANEHNLNNNDFNNDINHIKLNKELNRMNDPNLFADELTEEIIKKIIKNEITSSEKILIPSKSIKKNNDNIENILLSKNILSGNDYININNQEDSLLNEDSKISLNNSLVFSSSTYSIFNRTIKDKKAEKSINIYMEKIFPELIKIIYKEIKLKHQRIYENITTPLTNNSEKIMLALTLHDKKMFDENYRQKIFKEQLEDILDKKNLLQKFDKINNDIRTKDNISSDNYYDKILNECIIDTTIELINKERINFIKSEPLIWSKEKKEEISQYDKRTDPKKFSLFICKSLMHLLNIKLGLISDKYSLINKGKINAENENKINNIMKEEIVENEKNWQNLEIEETRAKLEVADYIFEMILRENVEILEHVENNRKRPDLYQYMSIYACPSMPRLEFQKTENNDSFDDCENDLINL